MATSRVIIDTDPVSTLLHAPKNLKISSKILQGCDDVLALLLALASSPEDVEVCLISVTYGNVDVQKSAFFHSMSIFILI